MARDPSEYDDIIEDAAKRYNMPVAFVKGILKQESGFNPNARSGQGALGIAQMLPGTAAEMGVDDPWNPVQAIPGAVRYLRQGFDAHGTLDGAAAYYHGGPNTAQWGPKTRAYVGAVKAHAAEFAKEGSMADKKKGLDLSDLDALYGAPAKDEGKAASGGLDLSDLDKMYGAPADDSKPMEITVRASKKAGPVGDEAAAVGGALIEGVPIVGPYLKAGALRGAAGIRSLQNDTKFSDELAKVQAWDKGTQEANPNSTMGGNIAGGVIGTLPLMAAVPAAFGMGAASLPIRMLAGGASGGALSGADTASREYAQGGVGALSPLEIGKSAGLGATVGGGAPLIGQAIGAGVNRLMGNAAPTPGVGNVNMLLKDVGMTPEQAATELAARGPQATLADINPALAVEAGGLASRGGAPTSTLKTAMANRAAGADDRVARLIDEQLGPKPDLEATLEASRLRSAEDAAPFYRAARESGVAHDVQPILADIDKQLESAVGGRADVLNRVKSYLVTKDGQPKTATGDLHEVRQALDDMAEKLHADTSAGKNAKRTLMDLRGKIDEQLKANPNMAAGDAAFAHEAQVRSALEEGTDIFKRGVRPEDFARRLDNAEPHEVEALRAGARVAIGDVLEQARRGELAGARSLLGAGTANRAKLLKLWPGSSRVLDGIQNEAEMRAVEQTVAHNSATAERRAAQARYSPQPGSGVTNDLLSAAGGVALGDPTGGIASALARRAGSGVIGHVQTGRYDRLAAETAQGLAAMGPARDEFINRLMAAAQYDPSLARGATASANLLLSGLANSRRR